MDQATLELDTFPRNSSCASPDAERFSGDRAPNTNPNTPPQAATTDAVDRQGFDMGWDHAHHGLVPPAELLLPGSPVCQGWLSGKAVFGRRTLRNTRHTRQWLQLRLDAWRMGIHFEGQQLTPNYLGQIESGRCPITRQALHGLPGQPDTRLLVRLNPQAAYAAGNLASMSEAAHAMWQGLSVQDCVRQAHRATAQICKSQMTTAPCVRSEGADRPVDAPGMAAIWWRLAALRSYATPLPFAQAATLPMAVLPPNRVRLLNAVQGLQALLTHSFATPGWAERCRRFAQWLPEHTVRQDFNLFVGAMAPRVLEAGHEPGALRLALEDAWLNERVLRRWTHLVLSQGEGATEALLQRATEAGLAGVRTLQHAPEQAVEGWELPPTATSANVRNTPLRVAARLMPARAQATKAAQALLC